MSDTANLPKPKLNKRAKFQGLDLEVERNVVEKWHHYAMKGLSSKGIINKVSLDLDVPRERVEKIANQACLGVEAHELKEEIKQEVIKDKVPLLRDVVDLSLNGLKEFLFELTQDKERLHSMSVGEAKGLATIAKDLNEMLRLDLGQSTQNVQVVQYSYNETKTLLEDLRKVDPVFEYPALEHDDQKLITSAE